MLGYYPAKLFTMLNGGACMSTWYGEVYNPDPTQAIKTEMGSGKFAEAGRPSAAYMRKPTYYDLFWFGVEPKDGLRMEPYVTSCYTRTALVKGAAPLESVLILGGPGGKDPGCQWPSP